MDEPFDVAAVPGRFEKHVRADDLDEVESRKVYKMVDLKMKYWLIKVYCRSTSTLNGVAILNGIVRMTFD